MILADGFEDTCISHAFFLTGWAEGSHLDRCVPDTDYDSRAADSYHCGVSQGGRLWACVGCGFAAWLHLWNRVSIPLPLAGVSIAWELSP